MQIYPPSVHTEDRTSQKQFGQNLQKAILCETSMKQKKIETNKYDKKFRITGIATTANKCTLRVLII